MAEIIIPLSQIWNLIDPERLAVCALSYSKSVEPRLSLHFLYFYSHGSCH